MKERNSKVVKRVRAWRQNNPVLNMLRRARYRAKDERVPFSLTRDSITIPTRCPILGIKLRRAVGKMNDGSPSLDKIVPSRGYVAGNVQVISSKANVMKSNAGPRELRQFAKWIRETYGE